MAQLNTFVNIKEHNLFFGGCASCEGNCCNGAKGFSLAPLILEDFEEVYKRFPIVFGLIEGIFKAYVVLNDGNGYCKYYIDNKCSIYDERTPACKLYPISPFFDNILVDTQCPSISNEFGVEVCNDGKLHENFYTKRLHDFPKKLQASMDYYESIKNMNNFKLATWISGIPFVKFVKQSDCKYIKMHIESLKHFDNW